MPLETESLILRPRKAEDAKECYQLSACTPKFEDLWFRQTMMADPETMAYNHAWGGTIITMTNALFISQTYLFMLHTGKKATAAKGLLCCVMPLKKTVLLYYMTILLQTIRL